MNVFYHVDGSHAAMVNLLCIKWGQSLLWQGVRDFGKNSNTKIRPINFGNKGGE